MILDVIVTVTYQNRLSTQKVNYALTRSSTHQWLVCTSLLLEVTQVDGTIV